MRSILIENVDLSELEEEINLEQAIKDLNFQFIRIDHKGKRTLVYKRNNKWFEKKVRK